MQNVSKILSQEYDGFRTYDRDVTKYSLQNYAFPDTFSINGYFFHRTPNVVFQRQMRAWRR